MLKLLSILLISLSSYSYSIPSEIAPEIISYFPKSLPCIEKFKFSCRKRKILRAIQKNYGENFPIARCLKLFLCESPYVTHDGLIDLIEMQRQHQLAGLMETMRHNFSLTPDNLKKLTSYLILAFYKERGYYIQ